MPVICPPAQLQDAEKEPNELQPGLKIASCIHDSDGRFQSSIWSRTQGLKRMPSHLARERLRLSVVEVNAVLKVRQHIRQAVRAQEDCEHNWITLGMTCVSSNSLVTV